MNKNVIKIGALSMAMLLSIVQMSAKQVDKSYLDSSLSVEKRAEILVSQMTLQEKISQMVDVAPAIERLDVPSYNWWSEALHGVARNGKATVFPQAIGMGATFDIELIKSMADAISTEARAKYDIAQSMGNHSKYAGLTFWSPTVNLFRDPRYGRGQECYGEDPFLMSKMGVAFVQGLQGDNPKQIKAAACAKHFAMHSGPEHGKLEFNVETSKQDLYESYLPAFKALVTEAKVEGVMTAYNMVFGKPSVMSDVLVSDILISDWGFDGYITSDCGAVAGAVNKQGYVKNATEAAVEALKVGVTLNCGSTYRKLKDAVEKGLISEKMITERCEQLFKTRFRFGLFDKPEENAYKYGAEVIHCDKHVALAREVAQKSIVLLKNKNNVLPLSPNVKVPYVTGPFANDNDVMMGSYYGISPHIVTIMEGVASVVSDGTSLNYRAGVLPFTANISNRNWAPFVAKESDVVICVVGTTALMEGEGIDAIASGDGGDRTDLRIPENQRLYINQLLEKKKPETPFILLIASGGPVTLEGIEEHCDAIMQIWYAGEQGGNAIADILFGNVSPSGKLPITFPVNEAQLPPYDTYSMQGRTYKYMTKEPMYTFGFGLTYSKTEISNMQIAKSSLNKGQDLEVSVDVKNVGAMDSDDVIQLYLCPKNTDGGVPLRTLKGFERVSLKKGASQSVKFAVKSDDLMFVNENGEHAWRKGEYTIVVGNASPGARSVAIGASVPQEAVVALK